MNRRRWGMAAAVAAAVVYVVLPLRVSDYGLSVLNLAGIAAVGALGLNLLTGYTGQLSLGHAAFLGAGAYTAAATGDLSLPVAVVAAGAVGAVLGLAVSPIAVRLRGHTVAVATLALVFVGQHVFRNWTSVTGGNAGRSDLPSPPAVLPGTREQAWFWLVWAVVAVTVWALGNVVRGRPGRAMVAVRSSEQAAAVAGVDVARTKVLAFVASSVLAAVAGALYGSYKQHVGPDDWGLLVSIQYLAMVLLGGMGTVAGPVLGALFVTALPRVVEEVVHTGPTSTVTDAQVTQILFGFLIVSFVVVRAWRTDVTAGARRRSTGR